MCGRTQTTLWLAEKQCCRCSWHPCILMKLAKQVLLCISKLQLLCDNSTSKLKLVSLWALGAFTPQKKEKKKTTFKSITGEELVVIWQQINWMFEMPALLPSVSRAEPIPVYWIWFRSQCMGQFQGLWSLDVDDRRGCGPQTDTCQAVLS